MGDEGLQRELLRFADEVETLANAVYLRHGLDPARLRKGADWTRGDDELDFADELLVKARSFRRCVTRKFEYMPPLMIAFFGLDLSWAQTKYLIEFGLGPVIGPGRPQAEGRSKGGRATASEQRARARDNQKRWEAIWDVRLEIHELSIRKAAEAIHQALPAEVKAARGNGMASIRAWLSKKIADIG